MNMILYQTHFQPDIRIKMRDGVELSANMWFPVAREPGEKFPAVLELIPYRKDDWRFNSDMSRMTYLAQRGYVGCRVDVRGTGSSGGLARDEYTPEETQDGYEVVQWLAAQDWSNGNVGMWGISYGGFTAIQIAKLQPPALKAIVPMYATDDRYLTDVHYHGGCLTASELAQYAVSMVAMNALPPKANYLKENWAAAWKARLENTPPWLIEWLRQQTDGAYWRSGSLAPEYEKITCAILHIGGWVDSYTDAVFRMQAQCVNAPRKALVGNWGHDYPDSGAPGPNLDWLHEMVRFFDYWLKGKPNGVMDEPALAAYVREWSQPEAFPKHWPGEWRSYTNFPIPNASHFTFHLNESGLSYQPSAVSQSHSFPHRPTWGTAGNFCSGGGGSPNGLARDLRPDEALAANFTGEPLTEPLEILGNAEAILYVSCSAPVANISLRLADVHPNGASALVTFGILNLTHRHSHAKPEPLEPGKIYEVRVPFKAIGYRWLPGHRVRITAASGHWPFIWPSPYPCELTLHSGPEHPSRLLLPLAPASQLPPPTFKTTPPETQSIGGGSDEESKWEIVEDVLNGSVTVNSYEGGTTVLPDGTQLFSDEKLVMTAWRADPAQAQFSNECNYILTEKGYEVHTRSTGMLRSTATDFHLNIELVVKLNGNVFFQKSWLETVPRRLV